MSKELLIDRGLFEFLSQKAHFIGGALAVLGPLAVWGQRAMIRFVSLFIVAVAIKEFWYDEHFEPPEIRGSGLLDFSMYFAGVATAILLVKVLKK